MLYGVAGTPLVIPADWPDEPKWTAWAFDQLMRFGGLSEIPLDTVEVRLHA
jgi:hypothetical protein